MKLPDKIKILDIIYDMKYMQNASEVDAEHRQALAGQIDYWTSIIRILKDKKTDRDMWNTIWHECLHGMIEQMKIDIPKETEEKIIQQLATGINSILYDNFNWGKNAR